VHRKRGMQFAVVNHKKNIKSSLIQKYLKGLVIAKKYEPVYVKLRMDDHFEFFAGRRDELLVDS